MPLKDTVITSGPFYHLPVVFSKIKTTKGGLISMLIHTFSIFWKHTSHHTTEIDDVKNDFVLLSSLSIPKNVYSSTIYFAVHVYFNLTSSSLITSSTDNIDSNNNDSDNNNISNDDNNPYHHNCDD